MNNTKLIGNALCALVNGIDWCRWNGGFLVSMKKDTPGVAYTMAQARAMTGHVATKRVARPIATSGRAGEWNAVCAIVRGVSRA